MERLRITIEFSGKKEQDIKLWKSLQKYSSPPAYIKDALRGIVPLPFSINVGTTTTSYSKQCEDEEDLMDI